MVKMKMDETSIPSLSSPGDNNDNDGGDNDGDDGDNDGPDSGEEDGKLAFPNGHIRTWWKHFQALHRLSNH
jgi:hypothetical protein